METSSWSQLPIEIKIPWGTRLWSTSTPKLWRKGQGLPMTTLGPTAKQKLACKSQCRSQTSVQFCYSFGIGFAIDGNIILASATYHGNGVMIGSCKLWGGWPTPLAYIGVVIYGNTIATSHDNGVIQSTSSKLQALNCSRNSRWYRDTSVCDSIHGPKDYYYETYSIPKTMPWNQNEGHPLGYMGMKHVNAKTMKKRWRPVKVYNWEGRHRIVTK